MNSKTPKSKKATTEITETLETQEPIVETAMENSSESQSVETTWQAVEFESLTTASDTDESYSNKKRKTSKTKVIRDSFSFPEQDYKKISELKKVCLTAGVHAKKSEVLRAGLNLLSKLELTELTQALEQVEKVQTGRPSTTKA
jgi:hypothetical protein